MEQTVTLLQRISQTAYKTQETVKTIVSYQEAADNPYLTKLGMTLAEIQAISISLTFKIITKSSEAELRESIHIMYKSMEDGREMYSVLKKGLPGSVPENLMEWLDKNMDSLKELLMELAGKIES
jgi:hypothetical protein